MAAVLAGAHQLANGVDTVRVTVVVEALADLVLGVALQDAHGLGVIAPEIAVLAVGHPLENGHRLIARLHVAFGGALVDRPDGIARKLDVMLELGTPILNEAHAGVLFLLFGQCAQFIDGDAAEEDGEQ